MTAPGQMHRRVRHGARPQWSLTGASPGTDMRVRGGSMRATRCVVRHGRFMRAAHTCSVISRSVSRGEAACSPSGANHRVRTKAVSIDGVREIARAHDTHAPVSAGGPSDHVEGAIVSRRIAPSHDAAVTRLHDGDHSGAERGREAGETDTLCQHTRSCGTHRSGHGIGGSSPAKEQQ